MSLSPSNFKHYAAAIDPSISIGIDAGSPDNSYNNWLPDVLQQSVTQGFTIGFISDHNYVQAPGSESDSTLLLTRSLIPTSPYDWAVRAADYTNLLNQYLGAAGQNVELLTTEFNSVYSNPGKQTTSLVNGLFVADSLGELAADAPINGATSGTSATATIPATTIRRASTAGARAATTVFWAPRPIVRLHRRYVPYPSYFAEQLASKIIQAGGNVVQARATTRTWPSTRFTSRMATSSCWSSTRAPSGAITGQFSLAGFQPRRRPRSGSTAKPRTPHRSRAQRPICLANFTATLSLSGTRFSRFSGVLDDGRRAEPERGGRAAVCDCSLHGQQ